MAESISSSTLPARLAQQQVPKWVLGPNGWEEQPGPAIEGRLVTENRESPAQVTPEVDPDLGHAPFRDPQPLAHPAEVLPVEAGGRRGDGSFVTRGEVDPRTGRTPEQTPRPTPQPAPTPPPAPAQAPAVPSRPEAPTPGPVRETTPPPRRPVR